MQPAFEDEVAINPFDFWKGANFKLKIRKVDGFWNYDKSEFDKKPSALFDEDDALEEVWKKQYSLKDYTAPTNFKSYDELKTRLDTVLAGTTKVGNVTTSFDEPEETVTIDTKEEPVPSVSVTDEGDEDTISYFEKLAEKD